MRSQLWGRGCERVDRGARRRRVARWDPGAGRPSARAARTLGAGGTRPRGAVGCGRGGRAGLRFGVPHRTGAPHWLCRLPSFLAL